MKAEQWLADMRETLAEYRNEQNAVAISKYFRNKFASFGLKNGERRNLTKLFLTEAKHFSVEELNAAVRLMWDQPNVNFSMPE
ncbi:MAG: DNA alkylation repair protein [Saprospiraceae bacterium]|nr:DNA alkylation repair protein [Candidatus Brachybacter algidus]